MAFGRLALLLAVTPATLAVSLGEFLQQELPKHKQVPGTPHAGIHFGTDNDRLASQIASVGTDSKQLGKDKADLLKGIAATKNRLLKNKLSESTERADKLHKKIERLQSTHEVLDKRKHTIHKATTRLSDKVQDPNAKVTESLNNDLAAKVISVAKENQDLQEHASQLANVVAHDMAKLSQEKHMELETMRLKKNQMLKKGFDKNSERFDKIAASVEHLRNDNAALSDRTNQIRASTPHFARTLRKIQKTVPKKATKSNNAKIAGHIASVEAQSRDMRMKAEELIKSNVLTRNQVLQKKFKVTDERRKKLQADVGRLKSQSHALNERVDGLS